MLPNRFSPLGKLTIIEVYEYFDMPILYCAKNSMGNYFIVFWCTKKEEPVHKEGWLYLPISKEKLNKLRKRIISFREAYIAPEQGYYLAYIGEASEDDEVIFFTKENLPEDIIPAEGLYIEAIEIWESSPEEDWIFRLVVKNVNNKVGKVAARVSNAIQEQFTDLFESTMHLFDPTNRREFYLYNLGADYSSLDARLGTNDERIALRALALLKRVFDADSVESLNKILSEDSIDPHKIEDLYKSILANNINVKIIPKFAGQEIELKKRTLEDKLGPLRETNLTSISSIEVPQANNIDTVIKLMEIVDQGLPLVHEHFDNINSPRQVSYYRDAAYSLGLITRQNEITSEGRFLLSRENIIIKYQVLANLFELSECGWKWMTYCGKSNISELDPDSAEQFILNCVPSLSDDTARRRATTLKKWLGDLQPYKIEYKDNI